MMSLNSAVLELGQQRPVAKKQVQLVRPQPQPTLPTNEDVAKAGGRKAELRTGLHVDAGSGLPLWVGSTCCSIPDGCLQVAGVHLQGSQRQLLI